MPTISGNSVTPISVISQGFKPQGNQMIPISLDFTGANATYTIDLTSLRQGYLFTDVETLFLDNSNNPNSVKVTASISGQTFEAPPYSNGFYRISGSPGSTLTLSSVGGASAVSNAQLYNFPIPPIVWLNAPAGGGAAVTIADGASTTLGSKADAAVVNPALAASEISLLKGILTDLNGTITVTTSGSTAPYLETPLGYQQIVSATLAAATALTVPGTAKFALIAAEGVDVRWRDDGVAPTAAIGMQMPSGGSPLLFSGDLAALQFIRTAAGSILNVSYYK
jgi:hypothetical protein